MLLSNSVIFLVFTSFYCCLCLRYALKAANGFTQNARFCNAEQKATISRIDRGRRVVHGMLHARDDMNSLTTESSVILSIPIESFCRSSSSDNDDRTYYIVELFEKTQLKMGILIRFKFPSSTKEHTLPTRAEIALVDPSRKSMDDISLVTVDIGQITTIWKMARHQRCQEEENELLLQSLLSSLEQDYASAQQSLMQDLPIRTPEMAMEKLYNSYKGRGRNSGKAPRHYNTISVLEEDYGMKKRFHQQPRIVSSQQAAAILYNCDDNSFYRRIAGAMVLYQDAKFGGRFKRVPCVAATTSALPGNITSSIVHIVNGGWLAVDNSIKKAAEGRKFAERASSHQDKDDKLNSQAEKKALTATTSISTLKDVFLLTEADERIARKLECLAMGEQQHWMDKNSNNDERMLEVEVRSALKAMSLPLTSQGAQEALILLGRWSKDDNSTDSTRGIQTWSKDVLNAAREFIEYDEKLKKMLHSNRDNLNDPIKDLTKFPSICIDSASTKFRDDAIGVRPRSKELVIQGAGKWEILIHIADLSDLYSPNPTETAFSPSHSSVLQLRNAAASRGLSRYDLPYGPLHLFPPILLESLALQTTSLLSADITNQESNVINRCVTFWAYIDERNGKILDSGLERTLISPPIALSYDDASDLLLQPLSSIGESTSGVNTRKRRSSREIAGAVLRVLDRALSAWAKQQQENNEAYQKRENRLKTKELISQETHDYDKAYSSLSFHRTRGHIVVDRALDLYASGVAALLRRKRARIPQASGAGVDRGGRLGTGPLRRYIDGIAQRQALSVLCGYGGSPMTETECKEANNFAAVAYNAIDNYSAIKRVEVDNEKSKKKDVQVQNRVRSNVASTSNRSIQQQNRALRLLAGEMTRRTILLEEERGGDAGGSITGKFVQAMATGRENEVIITGVGAVAKCRGVQGTLSPGERVVVEVMKLNPEEGRLSVKLVERDKNE